MNVYLYQNNTEKILKNDYIGEVIEIVCDFTTGDNWFTFLRKFNNTWTYWRSTNWWYAQTTLSYPYFWWIELKIPDSIFAYWIPKKIRILRWGANENSWWGWWAFPQYHYYGNESNYLIWTLRNQLNINMWDNQWTVDVPNWNPANTDFWYTIDLENKKHYLDNYPNITQTISNTNLTNFNNWWNQKKITMSLVSRWWTSAYWYLKKIIFYF